jgi:hypothetical protein
MDHKNLELMAKFSHLKTDVLDLEQELLAEEQKNQLKKGPVPQ